ncbi:hypothetical protein P170DRAFT_498741 [Aspergillus steynii IBT 23096]|uniref:Nuclear GTPase SLIP-GC n=1 Tax=Aspergillus steynii IBT 23096 TaxID=1392250 RepID=A0A2I2G1S7_9EURO|nr:uncharacterized protein P170DRAFT_498741 [Aspergillus steynii IBT 23096]PLB46823.1 hypothetical protein P170DRAFT_498741 [Aspergillus steynii IBT 23096]
MDDQVLKLAELHYIAEQSARHARIWEGQYQGIHSFQIKASTLNPLTEIAPPCPNFKEKWQSITPKLLEGYIERARLLDSSDLHQKSRNDYERFVQMLYNKCFADMEQLTVEMTSSISVNDFQNQLKSLNDNDLSEIYQSLAIQDEEDSDLDGYMSDIVDQLEYNLRDNEDPVIPTIEKAVEKGKLALQRLSKALEGSHVSTDDTDWKSEIDRTLPYAQSAKVIIGVVGSTGAGKSSLINAIADEEIILATNCMRASTAVATEISFNYGDSKYMAQIEFIKREDWLRELEVLVSDLKDNRDEVIKGKAPRDSEAAVAMDKIKTVYPWLEPQDILSTPIATLLDHLSVVHLLGSNVTIKENKARVFSRKVKFYVDSRGKRAAKGKKTEAHKEMGLWPLIRVVRVFVKADALSTGAVLVDLPGIFDTNSARVAVAEAYMKMCAAHWIVTPINRAVDDKVSRDLLSKNFKMQMQMDSAFNDITFICTKTDDVSIREVRNSLKIDVPVQKQREADIAKIGAALCELRERRSKNMEELDYLNDDLDELEERLSGGEHAIDPSLLSPTKRKHSNIGLDPVSSFIEMPSSPSTTDNSVNMHVEMSAEMQQLLSQYHEIKARRKTLQARRKPLNEEIRLKEQEFEKLKTQSEKSKEEIFRECIRARNEYSKQEIKRDFARGILDLDEENQADENESPGNDNEPQQTRDYDALERDLPVFCVSTRAYQKLRGRLRKEPVVEGFASFEETEIPQLQKHCIELTEKARRTFALRFLTKLDQLLQSMSLWSSVTNSANIIPDQRTREMETGFNKALSILKTVCLPDCFCMDHDSDYFRKPPIRKIYRAIGIALKEFPQTVEKWNARRAEGGLAFQTYRAMCKRQGIFRDKNWNDDLAIPMLNTIMHGWKQCFESFSPKRLRHLIDTLILILRQFHRDAVLSAGDGIAIKNEKKLDNSVESHCKALETSLKDLRNQIQTEQKDISRIFAQVIRRELRSTYEECAEQVGRALMLTLDDRIGSGTLNRMRELMFQRTKDANQVFKKSAIRVRRGLLELEKTTGERLGEILDKTVSDMKRDYYTVLIEPGVRKFSNEQIQIRNEVHKIVQEIQTELQLDELLRMKESGSHRAAPETTVKAEPTEVETRGVQEVGVTIKRELDDWEAQA